MRTRISYLHEPNDIALPRECQVGVPHVLVVLSTLSILWELSALLVLDSTEQYSIPCYHRLFFQEPLQPAK